MPGFPRIVNMPMPIEIIQTPQEIAILYEAFHSFRVIPVDGRGHIEKKQLASDGLYLGDSVGHWEDDTLVVDVANFNDVTWLDNSGGIHSDALHVTERYRRAMAHPSFQAEFDANQPITRKGVVNRVDWRNPHSYIFLDVKDENGKVVTWQCEGFPPNMLIRQGWNREILKAGDAISISGYRAKDGSHVINSREVTFPDGTKRYGGPPAD